MNARALSEGRFFPTDADQHPDFERARFIIEQAKRNYGLPSAQRVAIPKDTEADSGAVIADKQKEKRSLPTDETLEDLDPSKVF